MAQQCKATARSGNRCTRPAIAGGAVCRFHGGAAPQVKKAAALRLAELVDPAIKVISEELKNRKNPNRLRAALAILDRTGHHPGQDIHVSGTVAADVSIEHSATEELMRRISSLTSPGIKSPGAG